MKNLHDKVNISLIAKADSFTLEVYAAFKKIIMNQIAHHSINIYDFPSKVHGDNENLNNLKERVSFAIMGSMRLENVCGEREEENMFGKPQKLKI
ncbi:septin-7-like [Centruroides sculpturatus]|uniref:septin-7-like n=1 Tax=Centruroides sculpturatus TaxID=218467 RepID=UPI000C6E398A|nr:septin-7-like [Centruroides sculpturatus]